MKPLLKKLQVTSSEQKAPQLQQIPQENNFLEQHRELSVQSTKKRKQQFKPLRYSLLALMLAVPQIPLSGISNHQKAVAQTSCPAGTIPTALNWTPATGAAQIAAQTLTAGGVQATLSFTESIPGQVIDDQETRIDSMIYGGLAGPNLLFNIGPEKNPSPGSATLTINFSQPVTLASPLLVLDIDRDGQRDFGFTYQDRVTVTAFDNNSPVSVALRSLGTTTRVNGNVAVGINENSQPGAPDGNVQVTPAGPVSRIQLLYEAGQEYGTPRQDETIGLARISICAPGAGGSIGDTVYNDANSNSRQDAGETGIGDVNMALTGAGTDGNFGTSDDITRTTTTDNNGRYSFGGLAAGSYRVTVNNNVAPVPGFSPTQVPANPITLTAGQNIDTADFGFVRQAQGSIGDSVYNDANANNTQDNGETGIKDVTVNLIGAGLDGNFGTADDITFPTTTTDSSGTYRFSNLIPGNYRVSVNAPSGFSPTPLQLTTRNPSVSVSLQGGQNITNVDFGFNEARGSIGDIVFRDLNGNGIQDGVEPGISGVEVVLINAGPDGTFGTSDDVRGSQNTDNTTNVSDGRGRYTFNNLPPGKYRVEAVTPSRGVVGQPDLKAFLTTGINPFELELQRDQVITNADFGFNMTGFGTNQPGKIGDTVFNDRNGDGTQDEGEPGIPNVTLTLRRPGPDNQLGTTDDVTETTTTNDNGIYGFNNLPSGDYRVTVTAPTGFLEQPTTGNRETKVNLQPGQSLLSVNFGFRPERLGAAETPDIIVVKRITNVQRNKQPVSGVNFKTFVPDPNNKNDDALLQSELFLGVPSLEPPVQSGDEIEYTVYFFTQGGVQNIRFCDLVPSGTTFMNNSISVEGAGSGADGGRYLTPLTPLEGYTDVCPDSPGNINGAVVVKLGTIPGSNFGFVRFRVTVN